MIASCKASCAYNHEDAELDGVNLALGLASFTRKLLQQLDMDKLENLVQISLGISSFHDVAEKGRPLANQLGLSRRNRHIQLGVSLNLAGFIQTRILQKA